MKIFILILLSLFSFSCEKKESEENKSFASNDVAYLPAKDVEIQKYNLEIKKARTKNRTPCDTLALKEFILNNYPEGTYLIDFDKTLTYNIPKPAVIYYDNYIFAVIVKSKPNERLVEVKNIIGYDQSFIDLDSTKLGTAFFYLTLFKCENNNFKEIWEVPIPSHGGFNKMDLQKWNYNQTLYIRTNFYFAQGIGHIDYNYFLIDGINFKPHLLMTFKEIDSERTIANINNDRYPDFYERIRSKNPAVFIWDTQKEIYANTKNKNQTRKY